MFVDTQVFQSCGHDLEHRLLKELKAHAEAHRIALHLTDITMREVERQLHEQARKVAEAFEKASNSLQALHLRAPDTTPERSSGIDAAGIGVELYRRFEAFVSGCGATVHDTCTGAIARAVFDDYFRERAPFDGQRSKEFPDAFALTALSRWALSANTKVYVVTLDGAMTRAAEADPNLIPESSLPAILAGAAASMGQATEARAEALLQTEDFEQSFRNFIEVRIKELGWQYVGDLPEGEIVDAELGDTLEVRDWTVIGIADGCVSLELVANAEVAFDVEFEDRDSAMYDKEDGVWFGAETVNRVIEERRRVKLLLELDESTGEVMDGEIVNRDFTVTGPRDW